MPTEPAVITGADLGAAEQAVRYELATLHFGLAEGGQAAAGVLPWVEGHGARGRLLGCWQTEHGPLGRLFVLRSFDDDGELAAERTRARLSAAPFGAGPGSVVTDLSLASFAPFPYVPPVRPGEFGKVYEIRDYHLRPSGLAPTIEAWRGALPARHVIDPLTVVMYALDGPARIIHIWPFAGLDERVEIRRDLAARGIWPPAGAPEQILDAQSIMAWPTDFSPLH
ncbi:NIPSNAP family protein [Frankia sp. AvcI1]|uniref:NIPSNAP family protein n=1 Tax=Frankia sp. AvcI1 TaxID=573496 RepID=UPI002118980D|nr:NIPSNAP family protein [Frankia sp. AvcI1]